MGERISDEPDYRRVYLIWLDSNLPDVLHTLYGTGEVLRLLMPYLRELECIFQAEEILSAKAQSQAKIVDLPYCLLGHPKSL